MFYELRLLRARRRRKPRRYGGFNAKAVTTAKANTVSQTV